MAEVNVLNTLQCEFESHLGHMKNYIGLKAKGLGFDAHLTLMYTGDLTDEQEEHIEWLIQPYVREYDCFRHRIEMFGPNHDIPVVTVNPEPAIWGLRNLLEMSHAIPNPSTLIWTPHITLKWEDPVTLHIPNRIKLTNLDLY